MDTSVGLVQAYLHVNGYFTVAEYPLLEAGRGGAARNVTDVDILAFRFPGAGRETGASGRSSVRGVVYAPDPHLGCPPESADMIIGEVKEGRARFNPASRNPRVLGGALARFGCCMPEHVSGMVQELLRNGRTTTRDGHVLRMVAFGMAGAAHAGRWTVVPLDHVVAFLRRHLHDHWGVLRHAQLKDTTLGLLALLEKAAAAPPPADDSGRPSSTPARGARRHGGRNRPRGHRPRVRRSPRSFDRRVS